MQPNFGTNIQNILFENNTADMRSELRETIEEDIQYWLPYVKLKDVEIVSSADMHAIIVKLSFRIDTIGANVVINILANENALQIESVEEGEEIQQVGTIGNGVQFNTDRIGSY